MIINTLKKKLGIHKRVMTPTNIAESLTEIITGTKQDTLVKELQSNYLINSSKQEIFLTLASSYLFSFRLVLKNNDINIHRKSLNEIFDKFSLLIIEKNQTKYNLDSNTDLVLEELNEKVTRLLEVYENEYKAINIEQLKPVVKELYYSLKEDSKEIELKLIKILLDFILERTTLIIDYLIDISRNYSIIN